MKEKHISVFISNLWILETFDPASKISSRHLSPAVKQEVENQLV